jgi:RNA polymerase sigma-70 factor (ECF subfamily)
MGLPRSGAEGLGPDQAREIAEECYGEVLAYCRRHAPAGHEPADLAQETFLRFVRAGSYRDRGKPIAYLMRTARSVCVDASRRRRLETVALDFDPPTVEQGESGIELEEALAKLSDDLREAVELRYGTGLDVSEVAKVLGISRFSVRRRINAALRLLEIELREGNLDE